MPTRPVAVIIGMMGAGKTRVGKEVAQLMSLPFADADVEIEHEVGMRIPGIFRASRRTRVPRGRIRGHRRDAARVRRRLRPGRRRPDDARGAGRSQGIHRGRRQGRVSHGRPARGHGTGPSRWRPADAAGGRQCPLEEAVPPARPSVLPGGERPCRNIRADAARRGEEDDGYDYRTNGSCDRRDHRGL